MVWGLFSVNPHPGENGYYIFQKGAYQVGRKGCDIIIDDKGVSRLHAEIIVDYMICGDQFLESSSKVRIKDCSKYGTFVTKSIGSSVIKVQGCPNKESELLDEDLVAFGTGNARYKFTFVPLVFFASSPKPMDLNILREKMSSIGAGFTQSLTSKCTHVICDDLIPFNDEILDAILARKPLVKISWLELLAEKTVNREMPDSISHAPNFIFEGVTLKVADPQSREECLKGHTFILESVEKYKFKDKFPVLLELAGAEVVYAETQQNSNHSSGDNVFFVISAISSDRAGSHHSKFTSSWKMIETKLILAVVSGYLDHSSIASSPELLTSSDSTEGTVVADSDLEMETATSNHTSREVICVEESPEAKYSEEKNEVAVGTDFHDVGSSVVVKDDCPESETENVDVIFSNNLIVRKEEGIGSTNFKRFRKMNTPSGNSFSNLIPFSKNPYQETESENRDVSEYCREETKRKEMEAIGEALFDDDKGRRQPASRLGSALRILGRG